MTTNETIEKIKILSESGLSRYQIAKELNITLSAVNYYLSPKFTKSLERRKQKEEAFKLMEEQVIEILPKCNSINHVCSCLGLRGVEHYYNVIKVIIEKNNLDISHFGSLSKIKNTAYKNDSEYFVENSKRNNASSLRRLILSNNRDYKCEICGISEWNDKPISLQLHHINGNNRDNRVENLQILCPNCHSQTETYARSKDKEKIIKTSIDYSEVEPYIPITEKIKICEYCGKEFKTSKNNRKYCSHKCSHDATKTHNPTKEELIEKFKAMGSFCGVSREYDVSDNAVRKWFRRFNLPTHTKEMKDFIKKLDE